MILPSWFVGLLEEPALLGLHQHPVSQGRAPGVAGTSATAAVGDGAPRAPGIELGWSPHADVDVMCSIPT